MNERLTVGGQAVIEGVMMMSKNTIATAIRSPKGEIILNVDKFNSWTTKPFFRWPLVRGIVSLIEMMHIGMRTLSWSANQQDESGEQLSNLQLSLTVGLSLLLSIGLFILLPYALTYVITTQQTLTFNLIDGIFRLLIFTAYLSGIGLMADVHRIFQYHGAEHKTVNCYESGQELTPANVLKSSRIHPRCGTSLLVFVMALSIVLFSVIKSSYWYVNIALRVLLIPLISGISYEFIKFSSRSTNRVLKACMRPGLLTQELTTREPTSAQVEVAIKALNHVVSAK